MIESKRLNRQSDAPFREIKLANWVSSRNFICEKTVSAFILLLFRGERCHRRAALRGLIMTWSLEPKVWWARLAFFVRIPILLSLPVGVFRGGYGQFLSLELSVVFWAT